MGLNLSSLAGLTGLKGTLIVGALCLAIGAGSGWKARSVVAERDEGHAAQQRLQAQIFSLATTNAANEAVHALELADKDRALGALQALAADRQALVDQLSATVDRLRARFAQQGTDPVLSPAAQGYYDEQRQRGVGP